MSIQENNETKGYYILSLKHTQRNDPFITLWRPNDAGYCYNKSDAGVYNGFKIGYHDNEGNHPLPAEIAESLFIKTYYDGRMGDLIPNTKETWEKIGFKMDKKGYVQKVK